MYIENITNKTMRDYTVEKQDNKTIIKVILPGVEREDINVNIYEGNDEFVYEWEEIVFDSFKNECFVPAKQYKYNIVVKCEKLNKEYIFGSNSNDINAELKLGILTIEVQGKKKESKQIEIK